MSQPNRITGSVRSDRKGLGHRHLRFRSNFQGEGEVPNAKKPRTRPPDELRDKMARMSLTQSALPKYTGPYNVGMVDIEVVVREPRMFSDITRRKQHLLRLETVLFSIYYPTLDTSRSPEPSGRKHWSRETWLPRPRRKTAKGYGRFAGLDSLPPGGKIGELWEDLAIPFFGMTTMLTKIPALRNARLAREWPLDNQMNEKRNEQGDGNDQSRDHDKGNPVFPMLIFSHGLGGTRSVYSSLCGEFASYGFVVVAMEHRDGSGPRTYINHPKEGLNRPLTDDIQKIINDHNHEDRKKGYHKVDYIFPQDNPFDTAPGNDKGVDMELRQAQLELRLAEIEEAHHVMCLICEGKGDDVAARNLRTKGYKGASSRGLEGIEWSTWKGAFRTEGITMLGHSFGAATTVEVLRNNLGRFPYVRQGIIYDIWGAAVRSPENPIQHHIAAPILALNSEAFTYWPSNFRTVDSLIAEARSDPHSAPSWLVTVRGTIHISQSDFSILYPKISAFLLRATANPRRAMDVNVSCSFEFLRKIDESVRELARHTMIHREIEGFLSADCVQKVPSARKPKHERDMALKLNAPRRELEARFLPKLIRKNNRKFGTSKWSPNDEVWMHARPEIDEIEDWMQGHPENTTPRGKKIEGIEGEVKEQGSVEILPSEQVAEENRVKEEVEHEGNKGAKMVDQLMHAPDDDRKGHPLTQANTKN